MHHTYAGVISVAEDRVKAEVPHIFLGVSGMDCVNKAKAFIEENWEIRFSLEQPALDAFDKVGTGPELAAWFAAHYCYYRYTEHSELLT